MNVDRLSEIQHKLRQVGCPRCYHTEFHLTFQPGAKGEPATYLARCGNCGYQFDVAEKEPAWDGLEEKTLHHIRRVGCPRCSSHRLALNFRCELEARECFHVASCENCGASFIVEHYDKKDRPPLLDR
jgi:transcription elongation factor Elf1